MIPASNTFRTGSKLQVALIFEQVITNHRKQFKNELNKFKTPKNYCSKIERNSMKLSKVTPKFKWARIFPSTFHFYIVIWLHSWTKIIFTFSFLFVLVILEYSTNVSFIRKHLKRILHALSRTILVLFRYKRIIYGISKSE